MDTPNQQAAARARARAAAQHLILYDGVCGLCNRVNAFVLPRDNLGVFHFVSLQSGLGRSIVRGSGRNPDDLDTFYVLKNHRSDSPVLLDRSRAMLFVAKTLGSPWSWFQVAGAFPDRVLNWCYDLVARNRYRIFGRYEQCVLPSPRYRNRFDEK